jgi:hypothetical protein
MIVIDRIGPSSINTAICDSTTKPAFSQDMPDIAQYFFIAARTAQDELLNFSISG